MAIIVAGTSLIMAELPLVWKIIDWFDDWALRLATLASLFLTSILMLSAETRRHNKYPFAMLLLWAVYQVQPKVTEYALTHLSISSSTCCTSTSAHEQQLVSFWAPFLLLHLAGPDNIAAFALEDGKLSWRKVGKALWNIAQGLYVMFKYIYLCNSGVLRSAASIMLALGVARYLEKVITQLRGNFDNLWHSGDDSKQKTSTGESLGHVVISSSRQHRYGEEEETTLLLIYAHTQFLACGRRAMAESSVEKDSANYKIGREIFSALDAKEVCKVAGMEASLMYDVLYTKATVVHTWGGYLLRLVSPVGTAAAFSLFLVYPKDCEETVDIVITYLLLATAFFLDVVWLLSALVSTWAHAFLNARANMPLHHALLHTGWWRKLRRIVVSMDDVWWWLLGIGKDPNPTSRRMWSGRVGRYNLLAECTRRPSTMDHLFTWLASNFRMEDIWKEYQHSRCISELEREAKEELFERIQQRLSSGSGSYSMKDITTLWGQEAVKRRRKGDKLKGIKLEMFGREFQEDVLLWHLGTTIFFANSDQLDGNQQTTVRAIEALSEYLMFLVAVRPRMLPGLELRKLFEVTFEALKDSWVEKKCVPCCPTSRKAKLAEVLQKEMSGKNQVPADTNRLLIWVGNQLATELLKVKKDQMEELLELMLDVWVDKMLYAAIRCSKDSHAKQLGRGGELTTILWIVAEHAGTFVIGDDPPQPNDDDKPPSRHNGRQKQKKICHQDPVEPDDEACSRKKEPDVCPNISCVQDYCCMDDYYYC
ncbi:hypothetical protein BDA96_06G016600 [Sorghum bicolor]|uniref:DUF4220 domain-containing protein n=1 Tax=Sorghum bicolor TaxID=4558 RepID=A0A921QNI1_SORBI|nr:hypothetical protein BDA96_06G016600 [Sorghum bicolor]